MHRRLAVVAAALVGLVAALTLGSRRAPPPRAELDPLRAAVSVEVLRLDPRAKAEKEAGPGDFHQYPILGRAMVAAAADRAGLIAALERGMHENDGTVAGCFNPRHGLRATAPDGTITDYVICFECFSASVYQGDRRTGGFLTTRSPQGAFDAVLERLGVPPAQAPAGD